MNSVCNTVLNRSCRYSAVCGAHASHTWIKPNTTVSAPTNDGVITTQQMLSQPSSIPAQFTVNAVCNGCRRQCTTMYEVNRKVRFNPTSRLTCITSKSEHL